MWRESLDVHSMEVDMAFARKIEQAAVKAEREECAKVCEEVGPKDGALALVTAGFAAAIRARSAPS
jgi:hypothetical protein